MEEAYEGHGGHFIAAVTGSGNSEYVIRWTDSSARRLNATWTVLHVSDPGQEEDPDGLERNLSLARRLGAGEVLSIADNDVASCIVQYARMKEATALVIGKTDEGNPPFLGGRSIMEDILRQSGDLDVVILRGKTPVSRKRPTRKLKTGGGIARGMLFAAGGLLAVTVLGLLAQPALGYRSISILYLLTIIALPFACGRFLVYASAATSALLWNFLFIPPRMTFSIGSLEDILMFTAFFLAAFVGGFLTSRLKEKESALTLRERRMAFLYSFARAVSRVRGVEDVLSFTEGFLQQHLKLRSTVFLRGADGKLDFSSAPNGAMGRNPGLDANLADRCFATKEGITDGDTRLYLPLESQESVLGVLFVAGEGERTIRGEIRELVATLAGNMTLALEREILAAENERNKMAGETARLSKILLHHVSHELRTPLTTIKGSVSGLLEGDTAEDPRLRSALLSETMIAANKLNVVVEDLLAMSRLEAGRLSPHPELAYVSELLGAAQTTLGMEMGGRGILLDESARDSEIEADPVLMVQVFRNILRNFATYTPQGSVLRIEAEAAPGVSVLRFWDDGPGVDDRELPLLFDTFYRGSKAAAKQGSGLGLSICRGIVEVHGGSIEAGKSQDGGLLVTIKLPRKGEP